MITYNYNKSILAHKLQSELVALGLPVQYIETLGLSVSINCTEELTVDQQLALNQAVNAHQAVASREYIKSVIAEAMFFGNSLIEDFATDNILLGITQAGMTGTVRKALREVSSALRSGSLKDAIIEMRAVPSEDKDGTFINDTRLLDYINRIETYLGLPLSTEV